MLSRSYLLVHPEISRTRYNFKGVIENECLELEHISAVLKAEGHTVRIWDGQVSGHTFVQALREYEPQVVYVCGRTRQENFMLEYCARAKAWNPAAVTIIGGLHAQLCYERLYHDAVDYILTSYNPFHIAPLVARYFGEEPGDARPEDAGTDYHKLETVEGLCYTDTDDEGKRNWHHNDAVPFDLNRMPFPDREYFYRHPDNYRYLEMTHAAWVRTAYSCPYRCKFCHRNRMNASTYSPREITSVVDEIQEIRSDNIYIVDDDFLYDEERIRHFIRLIRERGIHKKYICYGRADFIASHEELMAELAGIGFYYILVGVEAASDRYLKDYQKRSSLKTNEKAIRICERQGLHMMAMFILDLDFTPREFRELYQFIRAQKLNHVAVSIYTPEMGLPSSQAYASRLITDNPSHYDYLHLVAKPDHMSVRGYYLQYYLLLIRLFLRAKRAGVYDFIDYGDYVRSFIHNIFAPRKHDEE